jgi:hypothetical protein
MSVLADKTAGIDRQARNCAAAKFYLRPNREADSMTKADYRYMAREIQDVIPLLVHPRAVADLRLLADRYERLAHYLEVMRPADCPTDASSTGARRADIH